MADGGFKLNLSSLREPLDDEDAGGGWDLWQSPSILDYSLAALRGPP